MQHWHNRFVFSLRMLAVVFLFTFSATAEYYRGDMNSWGTSAMSSSSWGSRWEVTILSDGSDSDSQFKFDNDGNWGTSWGFGSSGAKNSAVGTLDEGGSNLSFSESDTKYYTFRMNSDHGKYCVSETTGSVTDFSSVSHDYDPTNSLEGPVTVTIKLDSSKNSEEKIWVRYTTDGFSTDHFVEATGSSTNYSATIPALSDGTHVEFYVLSSTFPSSVVDSVDVDLVTLRGDDNSGNRYSYEVRAPKQKWNTAHANPTSTSLGSTNLNVYFDAYKQSAGYNRTWATVFVKSASSNLTSGTTEGRGRDPGADADELYAGTPQFTSTGTWYYAMRVSYGSGTNFWVGSSNSAWTVMEANAPTSSTLSITVTNLPESSGISAVVNASNPDTAVNLAWTRPGTYNVMIVRRQGAAPDLPTGGTSYTHNETYGTSGRNTVVYSSGSGSTDTDTGLTAGTEYYYTFFTENYGYYSPGSTQNVTTDRPKNVTWDGGGADSDLTTEENWANDRYPQTGTGVTLNFAGSTSLSPNNDFAANSDFGYIYFNSGASAFTLGGNAIDIATKIENNSSSGQTINNNLVNIGSSGLEINPVAGDLTIGGTVDNGGYDITVYSDDSSGSSLNLSGVVSGTGKLIITNKALVKVSANSTYSGNTEIDEGEFWFEDGGDIGASTIYIGNGGAQSSVAKLWISDSDGGTTVDEDIFVNDGNENTRYIGGLNSSGINTYSGSISLDDDLIIRTENDGDLTFSGAINMSYNGTDDDIFISGDGDITISGAITASTGASEINHNGGGTLYLSGDNATGNNEMKINIGGGGILRLNSANSLGDTPGVEYADKINFHSSGGAIYNTADITLNSNIGMTIANNVAARFTVGDGPGDDLTINGVISDGSNVGSVIKDGPGVLLLYGSNTYAGATYISNGVVKITDDSGLGLKPSPFAANQLVIDGGELYANADVTLSSKRGINIKSGGAVLNFVGSGTDVDYAGIISGSGDLEKEGSGDLFLKDATNTYSGKTSIKTGTIIINDDANLGTAPATVTLGHLVLDGGKLYISGADVELNSNRGVTLGADHGTVRVGGSDKLVYNGIIAGSGNLTKELAGTLVLGGANSYSGATALNAGKIVVNGSADNSDFTIASSGTLGGTGSVAAVTLNGQVAPGNVVDGDVGAFEVSALTIEGGSSYRWEIGNAAVTTDRDVIKVGSAGSGTVTINATTGGSECTLYLDDSEISGWSSSSGKSWTIIDAGALSGFDATDFTIDSSTYWSTGLNGGAFSISNVTGDLVLYFTPAAVPSIDVLGSGNDIANGDNSPRTEDGTDFGSINVVGDTVTSTFVVTNTGGGTLDLGQVYTNGADAADFEVIAQVSSPVAAGAKTEFQVRFNPSAIGIRTATIGFTNNVSGDTPYEFDIQGTGLYPGIGTSPATISVSTMKGADPADQTLSVTNVGTGTLTYSLATNQTWLSLAPTSGSVASGAAAGTHTVSMDVTGMTPGTSNGTITVTSSVASNSPQTVAVALTVTNIPEATAVSASAIQTDQLNINWTHPAGLDVMVVRRVGSSNPDLPTDQTAYAHNATYGTDNRNTVIYDAGSGTFDTDTGLSANRVYTYGVFSTTNSYYSPGTFLTVTTLVADVDGDDDEWVGNAPTVVNSSAVSSNEFIWLDKSNEERINSDSDSDVDIRELRIKADANDVYFMVRYGNVTDVAYPYIAIGVDVDRNPADDKMAWIADDSDTGLGDGYYTNGTAGLHYPEKNIIVHTVPNVGQRIELYSDDGSSWYTPPTDGNAATYFSNPNDLIEFKISRADLGLTGSVTGRLTVASYFNNTGIGDNKYANDGDTTADFDGSGALDSLALLPYGVNDASGNKNAWDEDISDGDIDSFFDVAFDANGVKDNTLPGTPSLNKPADGATIESGKMSLGWSPVTDTDGKITSYFVELSTNSNFNGGENYGITYRANVKHTATTYQIETPLADGTYYWRVRARDLSGALSGCTTNSFTVAGTDDDVAGPTPSLLYVGSTYTKGASQSNITDEDLANTNDLVDIAVVWSDPSGVFMTNGAAYASTNILSNMGRVIPNWDLYTTNEVTHAVKSFGYDQVFTNFYGTNGASTVTTVYYNAFSVTNVDFNNQLFLTLSGEDEDNDRGTYPDPQGDGDPVPYDRAVTTNKLVRFYVVDDDTNGPSYTSVSVAGNSRGNGTVLGVELASGGWSISGTVQDYSGVNVNGTSTTQPDSSPYLVVYDPTGAARLTEVFDPISFGDGGATNPTAMSTTPSPITGLIQPGVWTAMVVMVDTDDDRAADDFAVSTNYFTFNVPTFEWDAGGGSADKKWSTAANWTVDTEPTAADIAHINGGYTAVVSQAGEVALDLYVGDNGIGGSDAGTGRVEHTANDLTLGGRLVLGKNQNDLGAYLISGGTLEIGGTGVVGEAGIGLMTVSASGDVNALDDLVVGLGSAAGAEDSGSELTVSGGTVDVSKSLRLGGNSGADGTVDLSGGALAVTDYVYVGDSTGSTGTLAVSGGTLDSGGAAATEHLIVGNNGFGTMTVSGTATVNVNNSKDLIIGNGAGNSASNNVTVSGGTLNVGDDIEIGKASGAVGYLNVSAGAVNIADQLAIGSFAGSTGTVTVSGGVVTNGVGNNISVGNAGDGSLFVSGSGVMESGNHILIGGASGGTGTVTVSSGALEATADLAVGYYAPGTLTISGGSVTTEVFKVAENASAAGSAFNISAGNLKVNDSGTSSFQVYNSATLNVSGGSVEADEYNLSLSGDGTVTVNLSGGTIIGNNNFNVGSGDGGTARVIQTGGTLDLRSADSFFRVGNAVAGTYGYYTITNGVITTDHNLYIGRDDSTGTGVFHVVGSDPSITIGDGTTEDFVVKSNGNFFVTFKDSSISSIDVADNIDLSGTLSISNIGDIVAGEYVVITSRNSSAVVGTFDTTNWLGGVTGQVYYTDNRVMLSFTPEIAVLGTNTALTIESGDVTPQIADGSDFGSLEIGAATNDSAFVITNLNSSYALTLSGTPVVDITGADAAEFTVIEQATSPVAGGGNSPFKIRFAPTAVGSYTATVSIANNDITGSENPYTFRIAGEGVLADEPTVHASNMSFSDVTNVSMTVSWVNGNGANRIVVAKTGSAAAGRPVDGTAYAADANFGDGATVAANEFVVYNGSGSSVDVTGLTPAVTYYYTVYEYNGSGISINYYTNATPLSGSQKTLTYAPVITEGASVTVVMSENSDPTAFALTLHATDADPGDTLTWSISSTPFSGTASVSGTGTSKAISYTPPDYFSGSDSFVVKVTDTYGNYDIITVRVTVEPVNVRGKAVYIFE